MGGTRPRDLVVQPNEAGSLFMNFCIIFLIISTFSIAVCSGLARSSTTLSWTRGPELLLLGTVAPTSAQRC